MGTPPSDEYEKKKEALILEFRRNFYEVSKNQGSFSLNKSTSNLFRNRKNKTSKKLDVKKLNQVISVDPSSQTADVEGMTSFETLVNETLKYGYLPAVVPQLKTITVGGALVGLGIESSSFRYGLVHETILEVEVLTGKGEVVLCNAENEHRDLFFALPNSYGTLGYVLQAKLRLIAAKPYVRVTNLRCKSALEFFQKVEALCIQKRSLLEDSYLDAVIFGDNEMYIITAEFVDEAPLLSDYTYLHAYYQSIQKKSTQFLTTYDYIWRWDADWFWCSKHFGMDRFLLRVLFGKFMLHSSVYWKWKHCFETNRFLHWLAQCFSRPSESVIQDILIPIHHASSFYEFLRRVVGIVPIWICPFQFYKKEKFDLCPQLDSSVLYLDFGFWDMVPSNQPKGFFNQLIERKTEELGGFKGLYSDSFYSEERFWQIYPKSLYEQLKKRYDPHLVFKDLYEKCVQRG